MITDFITCITYIYCLFFVFSVITIYCTHNAIATINCGLRDPAKRLAFFAYARKLDVQVLCLQETYSLPQDESKWQKEWDDKTQAVFNSNAEVAKKADAGTAVLLNNALLKFGTVRKDSGGRILAAEIRCDCFGFQVVNVYAFTSSYPKQKREGFFNQIYDYINLNSTVVFLGDFNCVENPTLDLCPSKNTTITESKQLTELLQLCKMFDYCEEQQQENRKHTFFHRIRAQELIASMQLMTSNQVLLGFCQISFLITIF